jgi:hypothetical protein
MTPNIKDNPYEDDATHAGNTTGSDSSEQVTQGVSSALNYSLLYALLHHTAP